MIKKGWRKLFYMYLAMILIFRSFDHYLMCYRSRLVNSKYKQQPNPIGPHCLKTLYYQSLLTMPVELCLANMSEFQGTKIVVDLTIASIANVLAQTIGSPIQSVLLERNIIQAGKTANESMTIGEVISRAVRRIRTEGLGYLWRSNRLSVFKNAPYQGVCFSTKNYLCDRLIKTDQPEDKDIMMAKHMLSGGLAGVFSLFLVYPIDVPRILLASDSFSYKQLYKGFGISSVIAFIFRACYFGFYDCGKMIIWGTQCRITLLNRIGLAYLTTFLASLIAWPIIMVRKRIHQNYHMPVEERGYKGAFSCAKKMLEAEGSGVFFRGSLSNSPSQIGSALTLVFYDEIKKRVSIPQKGESAYTF